MTVFIPRGATQSPIFAAPWGSGYTPSPFD